MLTARFMFELLTISQFAGRFHPVLVHLPIGFLLLAVIFHLLAYRERFSALKPAVRYSLFLGFFAAIASCITGLLLSNEGDYNTGLVAKHMWSGIGTTGFAMLVCWFEIKKQNFNKWAMPALTFLVILTGHLGGSLTHGEGYLTGSSSGEKQSEEITFKPIPDIQQAVVYKDIVQPILQARCYNCHGPNKQKGKLRLDDPSFITKGGKHGKTIVPGNTDESEMVKRILLPENNDDHMPPSSKKQLTTQQAELLKWWVASGADYNRKVQESKPPEKIKSYLTSIQQGATEQTAKPSAVSMPDKEVVKAPDSILQKLQSLDVAVSPVAQNSNYLAVSFFIPDSITAEHLRLLKALDKQILWVKTGRAKLSAEAHTAIGGLKQLRRLSINSPGFDDNGLKQLKNLADLEYLDLSFTRVSAAGLKELSGLQKLQQVYLYKTNMQTTDFASLQKIFPHAKIDTGGYKVEFLASDTQVLKPPQ